MADKLTVDTGSTSFQTPPQDIVFRDPGDVEVLRLVGGTSKFRLHGRVETEEPERVYRVFREWAFRAAEASGWYKKAYVELTGGTAGAWSVCGSSGTPSIKVTKTGPVLVNGVEVARDEQKLHRHLMMMHGNGTLYTFP